MTYVFTYHSKWTSEYISNWIKRQNMISNRFSFQVLFKIILPLLGAISLLLVMNYKSKTIEHGDIRCRKYQRTEGVKCPSVLKIIPLQSSSVVRVVCLSDTHGFHNGLEIPYGDILIHGGDIMDLSSKNWTDQVYQFDKWLKNMPHRHKILVPGNHDPPLDPNLRLVEAGLLNQNVFLVNSIVLANNYVTVEGVTIAGLPHTPVPPDKKKTWPFGVENDEQMADLLVKFPAVDIFVSHNPPWHIGSFNTRTWGEEGSLAILQHVLMTRPKLHMFGHTHQGRGVYSFKDSHTVFINTGYEKRDIAPAIVVDLYRGSKEVAGVYMKTNFQDQFEGEMRRR